MKEIFFKSLCKSYFGSANMITKVVETCTVGTVAVAMAWNSYSKVSIKDALLNDLV